MRKFLLASVAALGTGGLMGAAFAQAPAGAPNMGQVAYPMANPLTSANDNNNYQAPALPGPVANPTPGTIVVHINARVYTNFQGIWASTDSRPGTATAGDTTTTPYALDNYVRLYFGGDSMATNGLRYGAGIEIRQNFGAFAPSNTTSGAGSQLATQTLYVRRSFVYAAGENWGILRVGQADGVIGIFDNGVTTGQFLINNWNGGDTQANIPGINSGVPFFFLAQSGAEYGNAKFVYLSPQFAGFDFGLQWAPNAGTGLSIGQCGATLSGCPNLSSGPGALDGSRILNQTVAGVRYQGTFGGLGVLAYAAYEFSGAADYNGPTTGAAGLAANFPAAGGGPVAGSTYNGKYSSLNFGSGGAALTFAGFTLAGNAIGGRLNGQLALAPQGAVPEIAYTASLKYVAGPLTMGVAGEIGWYQGAVQLTGVSSRRGRGIAAGASYAVAPGLTVFGEYMYQDVQQSLFNFVTQTTGSTANNILHSQGFTLGTYINF